MAFSVGLIVLAGGCTLLARNNHRPQIAGNAKTMTPPPDAVGTVQTQVQLVLPTRIPVGQPTYPACTAADAYAPMLMYPQGAHSLYAQPAAALGGALQAPQNASINDVIANPLYRALTVSQRPQLLAQHP